MTTRQELFARPWVRARLINGKQARAALDEYNGVLRVEYYGWLGRKFGIECADDDAGNLCRTFLQLLASSR